MKVEIFLHFYGQTFLNGNFNKKFETKFLEDCIIDEVKSALGARESSSV